MIWPVSKRFRKPLVEKPVWRWPAYFRCWKCAQIHTECTCGAYECPSHEECLRFAARKPALQDNAEDFAYARRALGVQPCSRCHSAGEYIEPSGRCWRCEKGK